MLPPGGPARPLLASRSGECHPTLAPDGRWLAYVSDDSGSKEVYVRSYPRLDQLLQVSSGGGIEPLWSPDGATLYFRRPGDGGTVLAASFSDQPTLQVGKPRTLFSLRHPDGSPRFYFGIAYGRMYDLAPDGRRFLMLEMVPEPPSTQVNVVLNWADELHRLAPPGSSS